jgi:hypothetical protein
MFMNDPLFDVVNAVGSPVSGAKAYFYLTGTDTLTDTYTSEALTTPNANPVIADSAGRFPSIYLDPTISYRLKVFDENDVLIADRDPIAQSNYFARTAAANTFTALNTFSNATGIKLPNISTTASAANAFMDSSNGNAFLRSTSSRRYKTDIETISSAYAENVLRLKPVWYRSTASHDRPEWSWYGLIAEEVAEIDPRLVHWVKPSPAEAPIPDGVQYDRLAVLLIEVVRQMRSDLDALMGKASEPDPVPVELASFAQPDETPRETKDRLMQALSNLRSMAVGQIPMTDSERAMLTTLEGAVAQQWFRA